MHARGINRIRHYYLEQAPEMARYFVHPPHDDLPTVLDGMAIFVPARPGFVWGAWQRFVAISGVVGAINSVLAGAFTSLIARSALDLGLPTSVATGIATFLAIIALHMRYQSFMADEQLRRLESVFPANRAGLPGTPTVGSTSQ